MMELDQAQARPSLCTCARFQPIAWSHTNIKDICSYRFKSARHQNERLSSPGNRWCSGRPWWALLLPLLPLRMPCHRKQRITAEEWSPWRL